MAKIEAPASSPSLLVAVQRRDPEAWRRLVSIYGPLVYDWGQRKGLQAADAADSKPAQRGGPGLRAT